MSKTDRGASSPAPPDLQVRGGEVVLDGHACSHRSRLRAERLTMLVAGVTAVRNRVRVIAPSQ